LLICLNVSVFANQFPAQVSRASEHQIEATMNNRPSAGMASWSAIGSLWH
jgi:hypothetical protein